MSVRDLGAGDDDRYSDDSDDEYGTDRDYDHEDDESGQESEEEEEEEEEDEDEGQEEDEDEGQEEDEEEGGGEEEEEEEAETFLSKNGAITWFSRQPPRTTSTAASGPAASSSSSSSSAASAPAAIIGTTVPGPTPYAASLARDIVSTFRLLFTPAIEKLILTMTNLEADRRQYGRRHGWWKKGMDETDLRAYVGLLILAGVYRSRGEAAASLWDAESGRAVFRATMPLKVFYAYSTLLRFDDRETRAARRASDKLAAVRDLWDRWADRLPYLYNPGPEITVDEQLVRFRGAR